MNYERYRPATESTVSTIAELNRVRRPNILVAGLAITAEAAQVGYLLNGMLPRAADCVTYFGNSLEEAISGAVRLVRHTSKIRAAYDPASWILVVDHDQRLSRYFDPLREGASGSLARHLTYVSSAEEALAALADKSWSAVLVLADGGDDIAGLLSAAQRRRMLRIVCDSRPLPQATAWPDRVADADIYVYGENLTGFQVPFGCYAISPSAYQAWNNPVDAMAQTSTFAANATALSLVIDTLRSHGYVNPEQESTLLKIENTRRIRNEHFRRFVNPSAADMMEAFGLDFDFAEADGMELRLRGGRTLIDCALGTGANLRGHNPPDIADELARHDPAVDYTQRLTELICDLTAFDEVLPAVSGATSVESALALARLARPGRPKIVTFSGNFSGKTIPSLNVSRYGPQRSASLTGAFEPYSADVVFVDPLSPTAADDLRRVLDDPQVGLFWCELIQGTACVAIPDGLLQVVRDAKHRSDFLVGIDEVLTGVWRSADTFLFQQAVLPDVVDITALAKPLSDMTIPVAATLATAQVLDAARQTDPTVVVELENRYKNNLGAHIAWHALHTVNTPESQAQRRAEREILLRGLTELAASSPLVRSVEGFGAHVRLDVDSIFPFRENTLLAEMVGQSLEDLILRRCGVILGRCRFFPPLFPPQGSMSEVVERLRHGFDGLTVTRVYLNLVRNFASLGSFFVQRQISRSLDRVRKFVKRRSEARRQFS